MRISLFCYKSEGKLVSVYAKKAYRGRGCTSPLIRNLGSRRVRVVNFTPRSIYSVEGTPVAIETETGWSRARPDGFGKEKIFRTCRDVFIHADHVGNKCPGNNSYH